MEPVMELMELMEAVMEVTGVMEEMGGVVGEVETVMEGEKVVKIPERSPTASDLP